MQAAVAGVQAATAAVLAGVEQQSLRPLQKQAFLCSARCCDSPGGEDALRSCLGACGQKVEHAQAVLEAELGGLQERLQRCLAVCQDRAGSALREGGDRGRAEGVLEKCVVECCAGSQKELPALKQRLLAGLK